MSVSPAVARLLEQEARALLTRLDLVRPFALHETTVPAAALAPPAQAAIERFLLGGRRALRRRVLAYINWIRGPGSRANPREQQRAFTAIRMQFNNVLSQFDLFTEAISQRSEHINGVWLSGLDVVAADALDLGVPYYQAPPVVCYLARGPGAAIRRARTRLPGGDPNPVAVIRVPRERMVGHGIASSLVHEVGHQGAALLQLVESLKPVLDQMAASVPAEEAEAWKCWSRWISEIVADFWSVGKLGVSSTLGLLAVVSLPRYFVFRPSGNDPHPVPYVRVLLSTAIGHELYPHPQWARLAGLWRSMYPVGQVTDDYRRQLERLLSTVPAFVNVLAGHRPAALRGASLAEVMPLRQRRPEQLLAAYERWRRQPSEMVRSSPTMVFAAIGQARAAGRIKPEAEARLISNLLTAWALQSTLDITSTCAHQQPTDVLLRAS